MTEFITVFEKIKALSLDEMASLLGRMCKNAESCDECPFDPDKTNCDCPCSHHVSAWKEFLQRETRK